MKRQLSERGRRGHLRCVDCPRTTIAMNAPPQPELVYHLPSSGSGQAVDADYFGRVLQDASLTGGAVTLRNGDALVARMQAINAVAPAMIERDARDLLSLVMDQLGMFLFPCPLYSSPLRMVLDPRSTVLVSSFEVGGMRLWSTHAPTYVMAHADTASALHCRAQSLPRLRAARCAEAQNRRHAQPLSEPPGHVCTRRGRLSPPLLVAAQRAAHGRGVHQGWLASLVDARTGLTVFSGRKTFSTRSM